MGKINIQRFADYNVNYEDERFKSVDSEKTQKISESNQMYDNMMKQSDAFYNKQSELAQNYADKQTELQKASTNQTINEINQAKEKATKDYEKEQRGAYTDYQKAISPYGVNAENLASQGLQNSGYSESSRINAFNAYQSRYVVARESFNTSILNYDNQISKARLNLDVNLAEIAYNALEKQLESALQGFQYKNQLLEQKANKATEIDNTYYGRWQDVLAQINSENQFKYQQEQDAIANALAEKQHQLDVDKFNYQKQQDALARSSSSGSKKSSSKSSYSTSSGSSYSATPESTTSANTNTSNSNSSKKVSADAGLLYQQYTEPSMANTKSNIRNDLMSKYSKGVISENDAEWLYNKLNLN